MDQLFNLAGKTVVRSLARNTLAVPSRRISMKMSKGNNIDYQPMARHGPKPDDAVCESNVVASYCGDDPWSAMGTGYGKVAGTSETEGATLRKGATGRRT